MIHFVGAGAGAPDLITLRGKKFLEEADVIIYAGSLVNPQLLDYKKRGMQGLQFRENDPGRSSAGHGRGRR